MDERGVEAHNRWVARSHTRPNLTRARDDLRTSVVACASQQLAEGAGEIREDNSPGRDHARLLSPMAGTSFHGDETFACDGYGPWPPRDAGGGTTAPVDEAGVSAGGDDTPAADEPRARYAAGVDYCNRLRERACAAPVAVLLPIVRSERRGHLRGDASFHGGGSV
jgi:hypothetical protein